VLLTKKKLIGVVLQAYINQSSAIALMPVITVASACSIYSLSPFKSQKGKKEQSE
jgi:hypothetical protein